LFTQRKDGCYQAKYKDQDGKWRTIADKDPERLRDRVEAITSPKPPSFAEIAEFWKDKAYPDYEDGTISCYDPAYKRAIAFMADEQDATTVTPEKIKRHLEKLKKMDYSAKTISTQRTVYNLIYEAAIQRDEYYRFVKINPAKLVTMPKHIKPPVKREAPPDEMVAEIRRTADSSYFGYYALYLMATGYRRGESLAVQIADIDLKKGVIHCTKQTQYKGGVKIKPPKTEAGVRDVPILPDIRPFLEREKKTRKPKEYLFCGEDPYKPIPYSTFERRWLHYCKDHGWVTDTTEERVSKQNKHYVVHHYKPTITPHVMRHGYATMLFEADVDEFSAQKYLGHADISITHAIYTHLRKKKEADSKDKLIDFVQNQLNAAK